MNAAVTPDSTDFADQASSDTSAAKAASATTGLGAITGNTPVPFYTGPLGRDWALYSKDYAKAYRGKNMLRGFLNSGFLNGYINRIEGNVLWMQLSNNTDHCLPLLIPATMVTQNRFRVHQPISALYTASGMPSNVRPTEFLVRGYVRYSGAIESLALPLAAAFTKKPGPQDDPAAFDQDFKPYGSGIRLHGDPNRIFLAGIIAGARTIKMRKFSEDDDTYFEVSAYSEILIRQDENPNNKIPVRIYRQLHEKIIASIRVGDPVYLEATYNITWQDVLDKNGDPCFSDDGRKKRVASTFFQTDGLRVADSSHIMGLPDEEKLPFWARELREKSQTRRRAAGASAVPGKKMTIAAWLNLPTAEERYDNLVGLFDGANGESITPQQAVERLPADDRNALKAVDDQRQAANAIAS